MFSKPFGRYKGNATSTTSGEKGWALKLPSPPALRQMEGNHSHPENKFIFKTSSLAPFFSENQQAKQLHRKASD
jgi:hypothetical protein